MHQCNAATKAACRTAEKGLQETECRRVPERAETRVQALSPRAVRHRDVTHVISLGLRSPLGRVWMARPPLKVVSIIRLRGVMLPLPTPEHFIHMLKNDIYHLFSQVLVVYEHFFPRPPPQPDTECFGQEGVCTPVAPGTSMAPGTRLSPSHTPVCMDNEWMGEGGLCSRVLR